MSIHVKRKATHSWHKPLPKERITFHGARLFGMFSFQYHCCEAPALSLLKDQGSSFKAGFVNVSVANEDNLRCDTGHAKLCITGDAPASSSSICKNSVSSKTI